MYAESDSTSPRLKLCSLDDGLVDVLLTPQEFATGYGNSWRRFGNTVWYLERGGTVYFGALKSLAGINFDEWGPNYADFYWSNSEAFDDTLIESGKGMTPYRSTIVDIYIRKNPTKVSVIEQSNNYNKLKYDIIEGEIL